MPADEEDEWEVDADAIETEEVAASEEREWRYSLSDLEDEDTDATTDDNSADGEEGTTEQSAVEGNVFGSFSSDTEVIEPGSPTPENVFFVVVGVLMALFVFAQFYLLLTP